MRPLTAIALWLGTLAASAGCIAYNEQCEGLVERPKEPIGYITEDIYLDKPNARHANNAIGQMAADAFVDAFADPPAQLGVVNGGAIRAEGICITRNVLPKGSRMTNGLLHEILLFENLVSAVDLTEDELYRMMEHSVARLSPEGQAITAPAGQFLQVSAQVAMEVDCLAAPGSRVTALRVGSETLQRTGRPGKFFRVALVSFLLGGGDGYDMLVAPGRDPGRNPAQAQRFGGIDSNLAADYMRRHYNEEGKGLAVDRNRILLRNCAVPAPPQG